MPPSMRTLINFQTLCRKKLKRYLSTKHQVMPKDILYFIALIPPEDVDAEITNIKQQIANIYNSRKALKVVPHITLKAPFKVSAENSAMVLRWFNNLQLSSSAFNVTLDGFNAFENKNNPVLFINPLLSNDLKMLQKEVMELFVGTFPQVRLSTHEHDFKPHITIAYRDLEYSRFVEAWAQYKTKPYNVTFKADSIYLLRHNGTSWEISAQHSLINKQR
jgi:2'-5' RNA ligase